MVRMWRPVFAALASAAALAALLGMRPAAALGIEDEAFHLTPVQELLGVVHPLAEAGVVTETDPITVTPPITVAPPITSTPPITVTPPVTVAPPPTDTDPMTTARAFYLPMVHGAIRLYLPMVSTTSSFLAEHPANNAQRQSLNTFLTWTLNSPLTDLRYTLYLEADDSTPDVIVADGLERMVYDPATFELDTVYYWQVIARNGWGNEYRSPIWSFRTDFFPDTPELGSMVTVPEGEFLMGCDPLHSGFACLPGHGPLHAVYLDAYAIDKYEVTNSEYRACVDAGVCDPPRKTGTHRDVPYYNDSAFDYYPVLYVSHWDAEDYCGWVDKRLPTEAEWEKAARGSIDTRPWPWGDEDWDCTRMNRCAGAREWAPARVDSFPRGQSPYGALNLAGNVFEWVKDYHDDFYPSSPYLNPVNLEVPERGIYFVMRGGSYHDNWWYARTNHRQAGHWGDKPGHDAPFYRSFRSGFRCARSLTGE